MTADGGERQAPYRAAIDRILNARATVDQRAKAEVEAENARHKAARERIERRYRVDLNKEERQHAEYIIGIERTRRAIAEETRGMCAVLSVLGYPRQTTDELEDLAGAFARESAAVVGQALVDRVNQELQGALKDAREAVAV